MRQRCLVLIACLLFSLGAINWVGAGQDFIPRIKNTSPEVQKACVVASVFLSFRNPLSHESLTTSEYHTLSFPPGRIETTKF